MRHSFWMDDFSQGMYLSMQWWKRRHKWPLAHKDRDLPGIILKHYLNLHAESAAERETRWRYMRGPKGQAYAGLNKEQIKPILECRKWIAPEHEENLEWVAMCDKDAEQERLPWFARWES